MGVRGPVQGEDLADDGAEAAGGGFGQRLGHQFPETAGRVLNLLDAPAP